MHAPVSAAGVPAVLSVDPRTDLRWHDLVRGPRGSLFVSPPWITAVCGGFDLTPHARIAVDANGRTLGGFAWIEIDDINGRRLSSLPFSDRADPPLGDHATW